MILRMYDCYILQIIIQIKNQHEKIPNDIIHFFFNSY
jgi:hypothetical protein